MAFGKTSKGDILDVEKAVIILYGENNCQKKIPVLFNPSDYNISRNVNYAKLDIPGTDSPIMQFINGGETSLKLTLHFDTQNDYIQNKNSDDVRDYTEPIMSALWIDGKLHAPPEAAFSWGGYFFKGIITDAQQSFTMFLPSGLPVRSKLDLTFKSSDNELEGRKKSPFESSDRTKTRYAEKKALSYGVWHMQNTGIGSTGVIADFNKIHNPRKLPQGKLLHLPPLKNYERTYDDQDVQLQ